jgi:hypothetical protein
MSRQVRHRVTAVVLGGLLLGTPLLTNGTANAEQTAVAAEAGSRQVTFAGGGVLGLSCRATPDVGSLTVPAESTVRVVNRTGYSAKLRLGGTTKGTIPDDGSTEVVFRRGTTAVLLTPNCALGQESTPVLVTATPSAPATGLPNPIPVPSDDDDSAQPVEPSDSDSPATPAGVTGPGTSTPTRDRTATPGTAGKPTTTRPHTMRPGTAAATQAATTAAQGMPQGGSTSKVRTKVTRGTGTSAPTFAGMPPGDARTIVSGVPTLDLPPPIEPAPAAPAASSSDIAAAEPVATMEPMPDDGPVGLLAAVAIVCVLGVAVGAIRAIVSQRASRTSTA